MGFTTLGGKQVTKTYMEKSTWRRARGLVEAAHGIDDNELILHQHEYVMP
jgi:hypothetical protein